MTVNDLTEKQVSVLVNGSPEADFDQRANSASYDIDINDSSTITRGILQSEYRYAEDFEVPLELNFSFDINVDTNTPNTPDIDKILFNVNGTGGRIQYADATFYAGTANSTTIENIHTKSSIELPLYNGVTVSVSVRRGDTPNNRKNVIAVNLDLEGEYFKSAGFSIGSITQSKL